MSSYGRPQADGYDAYDSYGQYEDAYAAESPPTSPARSTADPYPEDNYARDSRARGSARATASVGAAAAPTGRARVAPPTDQPRPRYDWKRNGGSAAVPVSPGGPATGRATVRPGGPAGPSGPAGTGPGGEGRPAKKKKRHWFRNTVLIMLAIMVITAGGGMVALSYYVDSVPPPGEQDLPEGSTILFENGSEMATLQEVNRKIIDTTVSELANVRNAVIAAEDNDFYQHSGVDFMGIVRAAWNNFSGGETQGASTIDQQYTRAAANLTEDSYRRKLQEAAMAYKLNQEHTKDEILGFYLNTIYFGRGAYGIQAAAEAYFGKDAAELSVAEAAVVAGAIRIPDDGSGLSPYDPLRDPEDQSIALERWNYVLDQMVGISVLDPAERAGMTELPEVVEPPSPDEPFQGRQGTIVKQVQYELEAMGIDDVMTGGYRVTTTIDKEIQAAAVEAARRQNEAGYWDGIPENVNSAIVAIDPANGGVLGYYGGTDDGNGIDLAGRNRNEETGEWSGGWPPGSTAKIYTLIAEMREGISFESHWKTSEYDPDWAEITVRNAGRNADVNGCEGIPPDYCTLRWSTQQSYNVPFAYFSERVPDGQGPSRILQAAIDAGITMMTDTNPDSGKAHDLSNFDMAETRSLFDHPIAYGQYPVTVLDHANGVATLAARGVYNKAHFVEKVEQRVNGEWVEVEGSRIAGEPRILQEHADAITGVLSTIPGVWGFALDGGRPAAAKTGTWEHPAGGNGDAWVVGYTPQLAAAVWVGDKDRGQIVDGGGNPIGSGGLPARIWQRFMNEAHAVKEYEPAQFPPAPPVGNPQSPLANGEEPQRGGDDDCRIPFFGCDDDDDNRGRGNGDGDGDDGEIVIPGVSPPPPPTTQPEPEQ